MSRVIVLVIAVAILWRQLVPVYLLIQRFPLNDFSVYIDGTKATLIGTNPYTKWFFDRYNYPPSATLFFVPLTYLPVNIAEYIFTTLSIVSLWFVIPKLPFSIKFLIFSLLIKFFPSKLTLSLGQINIIILGLIMGTYYLRQSRPYLAGVMLSIATAIKLTPAPLVVYFLLKKNYRLLVSFIIFTIFINFIAIIAFGFPLTRYYYTQVLPDLNTQITSASLNMTYMNQSITALLGRFNILGSTNGLIHYIVSGFSFLILLLHHKKFTNFQLYSMLIILSTLFLPVFVWQHHFVTTIPLFLALITNRQYVIPLISYLALNFYFHNSGQIATANPLIASHFLTSTVFLIAASSLCSKPAHNPPAT